MRQRLTKAALATSPNVVRLPTAAPRMVDNHRFAAQRRAGGKARKESPFADRYISPCVRAKLPDAAALLLLDRTPELLLSIALFEALSEDQKRQVRSQCEMLKFTGPSARAAAAVIQVRTIADSVALDAALTLLRQNPEAVEERTRPL